MLKIRSQKYRIIFNLSICLSAIWFIYGCGAPSPKSLGPAPDIYELNVTSQLTQLNIDGVSSTDIMIQVKKNGNVINDLPQGWTLYARHSHPESTMIIPGQDYIGSFDGTLSITEIKPVAIAKGVPSIIKCKVDAGKITSGMVMRLEIKDTNGNVIYSDESYASSAIEEYEFSWNGWGAVSADRYDVSVRLGKYDSGNFVEINKSGNVPIFIKTNITAFDSPIPYASGQSKLNLTSPPDCLHWEKDEIAITLKRADGIEIASNFADPLKITFIDASLYRVSPSPIPAFTLNCLLDSAPATFSFPGTGSGTGNIEVIVYKGDQTKEITYRLNSYNKDIQIVSPSGADQTISYGSNPDLYNDVGYIVADLIDKIINESYGTIGISKDSSGNISISKDLHGARINIRYFSGDNKYVYTLSGNTSGKYVFEYDIGTGNLRTQGEALNSLYSIDPVELDSWLASLSSDQFTDLPDPGTVIATGVTTKTISSSDIQKLIGLTVIAPVCLSSGAGLIEGGVLAGHTLGGTLYPKPYAGPVEITYGYPSVDSNNNVNGLSILKGIALANKPVKVFVYGNTYNATANSAGEWEVDNIYLNSGENKFKAICYGDEGCEVESGDATFYIGEPFFGVATPADRQVVWGDFDADKKQINCSFKYAGGAVEGTTIIIKKPGVPEIEIGRKTADSSWMFNGITALTYFNEGENQIYITAEKNGKTKTIVKNIIVAYKFSNTNANKYCPIRKGDMLFVSKVYNNPFDAIPKDPDHVGVYVGNRGVVEATWQYGVVEEDLINGRNPDYHNSNFLYAAQPRKIVDELTRLGVANKAINYKNNNTPYDWPIAARILNRSNGQKWTMSILGHYNGPINGFYCSELAYYVWEETIGKSSIVARTGMDRSIMMWPWNNDNLCSLLPAKLGHELMYERGLKWNE